MIERLTLSFERSDRSAGFIWRGMEVAAKGIFAASADAASCDSHPYVPKPAEIRGKIHAGVAAAMVFFVEARLSASQPMRRVKEGQHRDAFALQEPWLKALHRQLKSGPEKEGHWPSRLMGCMKDATGALCTVVSQVIDFTPGPPICAALNLTLLTPARICVEINGQPAGVDDMRAVAKWLVRTYLQKYLGVSQEKGAASGKRVSEERTSMFRIGSSPSTTINGATSWTFDLDRPRRILAVGFDPEMKPIFVEADGKDIVLRWPDDPHRTARLTGHRMKALCATVSKNGRYVVTGGADGLRLWSIDPPAQVWFADQLGGWVTCAACSFAGDILLAGCMTGLHKFAFDDDLHSDARRASRRVSGDARCVALSLDGTLVFVGGRDTKVRRWNTDHAMSTELPARHLRSVEAVDCNQSGTTILSGGADGSLVFCVDEAVSFKMRQAAAISCVCLSPDGQHAIVGDKESASLWNLKHHSLLARWQAHGAVRAIAFDYSPMHRVVFADDQAIHVRSLPILIDSHLPRF